MKIDHIAIYVRDLEASKIFYEKYFNAVAGNGYFNPNTGLRTYFLSFANDTRIEIMTRPEISETTTSPFRTGFIHVAFCVGEKSKVDSLINTLTADGIKILSLPRTSGDGYYEAVIADPDGNMIEIIA